MQIPTILPLSLYAHRVLGTPTDATWPGVMELPDFKQTFPRWAPKPMVQVIPKLSSEGRDLLLVSFVVYSRSTRVKVLLPDAPLVQVVPFYLSCTEGTPRSYFTPTGVNNIANMHTPPLSLTHLSLAVSIISPANACL